MRGYFQLREERRPDAYLLALAVDALPPVIFGIARAGWSPTVELTWHMRGLPAPDRNSTRLNSSHLGISYAVFCLKKKKKKDKKKYITADQKYMKTILDRTHMRRHQTEP